MYKIATTIWLIFLGLTSMAQLSPVPFTILSDTAREQYLTDSTFLLYGDRTGKLTIQDFLKKPVSDSFYSLKHQSARSDSGIHHWWFRFTLENSMNKEARISLEGNADQVEIYVFRDSTLTGEPEKYISGKEPEWSKKSGIKSGNYIPLVIQPLSSVNVFIRVFNRKAGLPNEYRLVVLGTDPLVREYFIDRESETLPVSAFGNIFFAGFFLLAAAFNMILYFVAREKEYFHLSLFLFFLSLIVNPWFTDILPRENSLLAARINNVGLLFMLFFFQFIRYYFQTKLKLPKWDKWLIGLNIFYSLIVLASIFIMENNKLIDLRSYLFFIGLISYFITLVLLRRKRAPEMKPFLYAMLPFMLSMIFFIAVTILYIVMLLVQNNAMDGFIEWIKEWANFISNASISWAVIYFSWVLFRRYNHQKKEIARQEIEKERLAKEKEMERNALIARQKVELEQQVQERTAELHQSLEELKATQAQLIHSEKMASLGQLTAGIAHEIQNPLNFVNNFSDLNRELLEEMKAELEKGDKDEAKAIAGDIIENEKKISFHGKRADAIVKSMLQHSRSGDGKKEPVDLNDLCDEYLRLSYHGLRAKDKSFNVKLETSYDAAVGKPVLLGQEIGRVLLNIYNNAFYAVHAKALSEADAVRTRSSAEGNLGDHQPAGKQDITPKIPVNGAIYEPVVSVQTLRSGTRIIIRVRDNGKGIPSHLQDKIFIPFFTTKPTGEGTGLGLSLSYDIITKGHGGDIRVSSVEGEGSEFIISLPG